MPLSINMALLTEGEPRTVELKRSVRKMTTLLSTVLHSVNYCAQACLLPGSTLLFAFSGTLSIEEEK
jgi:hypothetical protein